MDSNGSVACVDIIDKIGGMDVFTHIIHYLMPWEQIGLRSVCKDFHNAECIKTHRVAEYYDYFENYWQQYFQNSVIQLYCRPLLEQHMDAFEYHTLFKISMDDIASNGRDLIQSLKYMFLFQKDLITSALTLQRFSYFSKIIKELSGIYISNRHYAHALNEFLRDVLTNYSRYDDTHFKLLFFHNCILGTDGMVNICTTMLKSNRPFQLSVLFVSNDLTLTDECIALLFECIESRLPNLKMLCLRSTSISDIACRIMYKFYQKHYNRLCFCNSDTVDQEDIGHKMYPTQLSNINITFNERITSNGIKQLNKLFFLGNGEKHSGQCFFSSLAIATSESLPDTTDRALSSRFRFMNNH